VNFDESDIKVISNINEHIDIHRLKRTNSLKFKAPKGWKILEQNY
jgi:hypothetical protein